MRHLTGSGRPYPRQTFEQTGEPTFGPATTAEESSGSADADGPGPRLSRRSLLALVPGGVATALLAACGGGSDKPAPTTEANLPPIKKLTFMAGFKPQANLPFVGAYVAKEKGFFAGQRLEVEIRHAQSGEHLQLVLAGEVNVTTANGASVIKRNAQNLNIVSIALIGQRSEQGFAVLDTSSIKSVKDWEGKTFGYKGSVPPEFLAITRANGVDPAKVNQVSVGFDPRILAEGKVDILPVFFSNEPGVLAAQGVKTRIFDPNDYGVESLGLTYISTGDQIAKDPDGLTRFLKAALKGIDYADKNREEAVDIVMKYAPDEVRSIQKFMMETELERAKTDLTRKNGIGWQTREQWQKNHDVLLEYKGIDKAFDVAIAFRDEFVKQVYKDGKLAG
jgi:ABC-type nitrate/sulfonate/bicarbonate transport system substrate-binding protein